MNFIRSYTSNRYYQTWLLQHQSVSNRPICHFYFLPALGTDVTFIDPVAFLTHGGYTYSNTYT